MPNDTDLRALLEALEAEQGHNTPEFVLFQETHAGGLTRVAHMLSSEDSARLAAILRVLPSVRKILRGEFGPLPLVCERPRKMDQHADGSSCWEACGACLPCRINEKARKP